MLVLDSEALSALASGPAPRQGKVRALAAEARRRNLPVGTVAAVLAEVIRGRPRDASVFAALRREAIEVYPVTSAVAIEAGRLLERVGAGSERAIDAFVVAAAHLAGGALVATVDMVDVGGLAGYTSGVTVVDIR